ncbi:UNVERIFIED_CONTAM: hypothetical protein Sindi_2384200 [Sesamum indicum]
MLMPILTPFDALFADAIRRKVAALSRPPSPPNKEAQTTNDMKKVKEVGGPSAAKMQDDRRRFRGLRFAPELDGIHCFETILPYDS